jgi:hypothetical protein
VLSLNEVSDIALSIDAADDEAPPWSSAIFLGDESKVEALKGVYLD